MSESTASEPWPPKSRDLDPEATRAYFEDRWNRDYGLGLYFSALHDLGDHMLATAAIDGEWVHRPHALCDGLAFVDELNRRFDLGTVSPPAAAHGPPRGLLQWSRALAAVFGGRRKAETVLRTPTDAPKAPQGGHFHLTFRDPAPINRLLATLLHAVNGACMAVLSPSQESRWMIPVSVRGHHPLPPKSQLAASYVAVVCRRDDSPEDLHQKIVMRLKQGQHWAYFLLSRLGLALGRWVIVWGTKWSLASRKARWLGSFSFFGRLGGNGKRRLELLHSVRPERPIGCALYEYNGEVHLTVSFHASLGLGPGHLQEIERGILRSVGAAGR